MGGVNAPPFYYEEVMKEKHKKAHMRAALEYAKCSTAVRAKVGCLIVKDNRVISIGYNGMPSGWSNVCERTISEPYQPDTERLETKREVLHAETNAIAKLARSSESGDGAYVFTTHAPCIDCAKLIYQSGIAKVYYHFPYKSDVGITFLDKCEIPVFQLSWIS